MIKRIMLHLVAALLLLPCLVIFCGGIEGFIATIYASTLFIYTAKTERGRRFCRRYYHEILRIENSL